MSCTETCRRPTGTRHAHCGACHETFSGVSLFDDHRKGGHCTPPADLGMRNVAGLWRGKDVDPRFASAVAPQTAQNRPVHR